MRKKFVYLLISAILMTACSPKEDTSLRDSLRQESEYKRDVTMGYSAVTSLKSQLAISDNVTYQTAKSSSRLSDALHSYYFPTEEWQGVSLLSVPVNVELFETFLTGAGGDKLSFRVLYTTVSRISGSKTGFMDIEYSIKTQRIEELDFSLF